MPFNLPWQLLFYIIKAQPTAIHIDTNMRQTSKRVFVSEGSVYAVMNVLRDVARNAVALTQHKECVHEHR